MRASHVLPGADSAPRRLTKTIVDKLVPTEKDYFVWCSKLSGFGVRVRPTGKMSFVVQYRTGGRGTPTRRKAIGAVGVVTVDKARKTAEEYLASAQLGNDLIGAERAALRQMNVAQLCNEYVQFGMATKKESTIKTDMGRIKGHILPLVGKKKLSAVTRKDIERFRNDVAAGKTACDTRTEKGRSIIRGGKGTATRTVRLLGGIFTYAVNQSYLDTNPCTGVKLFKDGAKERFLSGEEQERLAASLRQAETAGLPWTLRQDAKIKHRPHPAQQLKVVSPHVTGAIRLLLLTGCRLREILNLRWEDVDIERGFLILPDSKTGRKPVYLSNMAIEVLVGLPRVGQFVIAGANPNRPRADLKRPWKRISEHAGLSDVRIHDLRHTFASMSADAGLSLPMIGKLLGHKSPETTARYAHLADDPLRHALNKMSSGMPFGRDKGGETSN